jgi:CRISPR system Cascade subunit CasC
MSFISIHIIQSLPPSNPNRGRDGDVKSTRYGGILRSRMSSQSQKRATRMWYQQNSGLDRRQLASRSRLWAEPLAAELTWARDYQRESIAAILLALFNSGAENIFANAIAQQNLLFLAEHEVKKLAMLAEHHGELLCDLVDRLAAYKVFMRETPDPEIEVPDAEPDSPKAKKEKKKAKKADFSQHPTKAEIKPLISAIGKELNDSIPGDVALFGRMMSSLIETSVDGSVQVADAISVNQMEQTKTTEGWRSGQIDFFSAKDDLGAETGAGMIGEVSFSCPVHYRYANVAAHEVERLMGDREAAMASIAAFIKGFVMSLPSGMQTSFAHATLPDFVLIQVGDTAPFSLVSAFLAPINTPDMSQVSEHGGISISQRAVRALVDRRDEMSQMYGIEYLGEFTTSIASHCDDSVPLDVSIRSALSLAFGAETP